MPEQVDSDVPKRILYHEVFDPFAKMFSVQMAGSDFKSRLTALVMSNLDKDDPYSAYNTRPETYAGETVDEFMCLIGGVAVAAVRSLDTNKLVEVIEKFKDDMYWEPNEKPPADASFEEMQRAIEKRLSRNAKLGFYMAFLCIHGATGYLEKEYPEFSRGEKLRTVLMQSISMPTRLAGLHDDEEAQVVKAIVQSPFGLKKHPHTNAGDILSDRIGIASDSFKALKDSRGNLRVDFKPFPVIDMSTIDKPKMRCPIVRVRDQNVEKYNKKRQPYIIESTWKLAVNMYVSIKSGYGKNDLEAY